MTKHFARLAGPSIITNFCGFMIMTINAVIAGQFVEDSVAKLTGFGLGTMMLNMVCRFVLTGINCAQETLVSQAFGQRQLKLSGVYLSRGFFIMTVVYLPLAILQCFSYQILILMGQGKAGAIYAQEYIAPMIPAMYFFCLFDLLRRYLICLQYS